MRLRGHDPVLVGAPLLVGALAGGYLLGVGSRTVQVISCWLAVAAFQTAMAVFAFRAARMIPRGDPDRRFWAMFGVAGAIYAAGDLSQLGVALHAPDSMAALSGATIARYASLALGSGVLVVVMLTYPLGMRSGRDRARFWLDLITVMVAAGAGGLYWTVPAAGADMGSFAQKLLVVASGPVVNLLAAFAVGKVLLGGRAPFTLQCALLGGASACVEGAARALGPALAAAGRPQIFFSLSVASHALLMMAAWGELRRYGNEPEAPSPRRRRPYSPLPYVAVGATYLLLTVTLVRHGLDLRAWTALTGALASTALVVVRQLVAFADNARLLDELDGKVRELHATESVLRTALSERDEMAARLRELAFSDRLTGLANRALFDDRLADALGRRDGSEVAVLLIDLDDFKPVNDRFGHAAGDAVLVEAGIRLRDCVRATDLVARLGGDEFAVLLEQPHPDGVAAVAERIVRAMETAIAVAGTEVRVPASVGAAVTDGDRSRQRLLHRADEAMYAAKCRGKGTFSVAA